MNDTVQEARIGVTICELAAFGDGHVCMNAYICIYLYISVYIYRFSEVSVLHGNAVNVETASLITMYCDSTRVFLLSLRQPLQRRGDSFVSVYLLCGA